MFLEVVNFSKIYEKIQQAKSLQTEISETELRLSNAIEALTNIGINTSNLKMIVHKIDRLDVSIDLVNFSKNNYGVLSIGSEVDSVLDDQIRTIISPLLGRNITSPSVEKDKKYSIDAIKKEVAKYGMKASDFDAIMKKMFTPGQTDLSYLIYTNDGYLISYGIDESSPFGGGGNGGGSGSGGGSGGNSSSWADGIVLTSDFMLALVIALSGGPLALWVVKPSQQQSNLLTSESRLSNYNSLLNPSTVNTQQIGFPVLKILRSRIQTPPNQLTLTNYFSNLLPGGTQVQLADGNETINSLVSYSNNPTNFPDGTFAIRYTLSKLDYPQDNYYYYGGLPVPEGQDPPQAYVIVEGTQPDLSIGFTIKSVVEIGGDSRVVAYYGYGGSRAGEVLFGLGVTFKSFIFVPNDSSKPNWILAGERLQSAPIPHNGTSETKTIFNAPAGMKLRFDWGVDSESTYDSLDIWLDGQLIVGDGLPSGLESGSNQGTYTTPSELSVGSHTLVLKYRKDEVVASGQDAAWITDISLIPVEEGNGDEGSGGSTEPSLQWYEEPVSGILTTNIGIDILDSVLRSGSNVLVGEISSHEFVINNSLESDSRQETLDIFGTLRGSGSFKIYRNGILLWDLPSEASEGEMGPQKNIPVEYRKGEPGAYYWVTGSVWSGSAKGTVPTFDIDGNPNFDLENPNSTLQTNDIAIMTMNIGLMRGENVIRFEFVPSQPNSSVRIFNTVTNRYPQPA